jgi:phosphoribosyl-ATP pyrophosphohydrolase/phosphoribosyl-AMP cyclohydrolase
VNDGSAEVSSFGQTLGSLVSVIANRKEELPANSYTTYLFQSGIDKILKKIGEESAEIIIAAKNPNQKELVWEVADLVYHLLVLLSARNVSLGEVASELKGRALKSKSS